MTFRLASIVLMVALLVGSTLPAVTYVGPVQAGCTVLYQRSDGSALQVCPPAVARAAPPHDHSPAAGAPAPANPFPADTTQTYLALVVNEHGPVDPYPSAPLCPDSGELHNNSLFHTLWDSERGCHYDHEHGTNPFTPEVAQAFPGFDLYTLLGGVGIGHTNPSSPMENTHKHGGFKWDVTLAHNAGCDGREGVPTGVDALVVQYHAFGDYAIEMESRIHSAAGLLRQCRNGNPTDFGYIYVVQHQDYGQRVAPYQGAALPYPDTPLPAYNPSREPYFAADCFGTVAPCNKYPTLEYAVSHNIMADSTWISEPENLSGSGSRLFSLLFRVRDTYQLLDGNDQTYPFTFRWLCSEDQGVTYSGGAGCRYNNSTTRVHEIIGEIPAAWDNLAGFDTDARAGRVTAEGYVTRFGDLNPACTEPGPTCFPIKLVQAFTGRYGTQFRLPNTRPDSFSPGNLPERDIYFCNGQVCDERDPGAVASGWIGPQN